MKEVIYYLEKIAELQLVELSGYIDDFNKIIRACNKLIKHQESKKINSSPTETKTQNPNI